MPPEVADVNSILVFETGISNIGLGLKLPSGMTEQNQERPYRCSPLTEEGGPERGFDRTYSLSFSLSQYVLFANGTEMPLLENINVQP